MTIPRSGRVERLGRAACAGALVALCLGALAGPASAAGAKRPAAAADGAPRLLMRSGAWQLGYAIYPTGLAACFVGSADDGSVLEYVRFNNGLSAFRLHLPGFEAAAPGALIQVAMQIDGGKMTGIQGQVANGLATMPVDRDKPEFRAFIRAMADGTALRVYDMDGTTQRARFALNGARKALSGFGPCIGRLPRPPADAPRVD